MSQWIRYAPVGGWLALLALGLLQEAQAARVRLQDFAALAIYPAYSAPATVISLNDSVLSAETAGHVKQIGAQVGQQVTSHDSLLTLGCEDQRIRRRQAQAELSRAEAANNLAERQWRRARVLSNQNSVSDELLDQRDNERVLAEAQLQSATASLEAARLDEQRCQIRAPFPATVLERLTQVGAWVQIGTPVLRVIDNRRLEVSAQVAADQAVSLEATDHLWFESGGKKFSLALRTLVAVIDPRARTREARLVFSEQRALPGAAGRLYWQARQAHVPADMLLQRGGRLGVFQEQDGRALFIVLPEARLGAPAPAPMLSPDTRLITDGRYGLQDGDPVNE